MRGALGAAIRGVQPMAAAAPAARPVLASPVAANGLARATRGAQPTTTPAGTVGFLGRMRAQPAQRMRAQAQQPARAAEQGFRNAPAIDPATMAAVESIRGAAPVSMTPAQADQARALMTQGPAVGAGLASPSAQAQVQAQRAAQQPAPVDPRIAEQAAYEASWRNLI